MSQNIDYNDELHAGTHTFLTAPVVPDSSFGDAQMSASDPVSCTKLDHQHNRILAQAHGSASADERRVIHCARAAGVLTAIRAGVVVAAVGDSTVTVDLYKNGASILSAVITLDSGDAAFAEVAGAIDTDDYIAGDVFEVVIDATVGTGTLPQGVYVDAVFREGAG